MSSHQERLSDVKGSVPNVSVDSAAAIENYLVPPMVRKIPNTLPDTSLLPRELRDRVDSALGATPVNARTGKPVPAKSRRVFLGPKGDLFPAGNLFLQRLRTRPEGTEAVYASTVRIWVEFCTSQGADPLGMNLDTLLEYRDDVRLELDGVSGKTWNQNLVPLRWFADTATAAGLMDPIPSSDWRALRLTDTSVRWPRVVDAHEYQRLRSAGIQAMTLEGRMSKAGYALRTPLRDALYADFLLLHGTRRAEAAHLTLLDLPLRREGYARNIGHLPANICKWGSGRDFEEVAAWAKRLARYHDAEWLTTVSDAQKNLRRLQQSQQLLVVTDVADRFGRGTKLSIRGLGKRSLMNLSKEQRRAMVCTANVARDIAIEPGMGPGLGLVEPDWLIPLAVFPGVWTPMVAPEAWSGMFREANARVTAAVRKRGLPEPRRITPHMLRHTFATEWLSAELNRIAEHDRDVAHAAAKGDYAALRRRHMNPLVRMMRLLGHRRLDTTLLYIDYIMREEQTAFMPGDSWVESFLGQQR